MPIRIEQTPDMEPGAVRLMRSGPGSLHGDIEVSIARIDMGSPRYLDPRYTDAQAWGAGERWFRPEPTTGEGLVFGLGPAATWQLKPHMPYLVRLRDASGTVIEDRMSWPVIRLPSSAPPPGQSHVIGTASEPETEPALPAPEPDPLDYFADLKAEADPEPAPPPPAREPEPAPEPEPKPKPRRGAWLGLSIAALLLVLIGGGIAYLWTFERELIGEMLPEEVAAMIGLSDEKEAPVEEPQGIELSLAGARSFLKGKPPAEEAAREAQRFTDAGQADGAFLLLKYAAKEGNGEAGERLGDLYNPSTFRPGGTIKAPNANQAAVHYLEAAAAGTATALYKAGQLLKDAKIDDQSIAGKVAKALKDAADAGDQKAKELL